MARLVRRTHRQGKRIFSGPQWACLGGHLVRERDLLAARDPESPRVRPTLPRLSILSDSSLNRAAKLAAIEQDGDPESHHQPATKENEQ
jgi:hypothetical protein